MTKPQFAKPKIFGLTGGIGSGKSMVAKLFAKSGIPCVDADSIARALREPNGAAAPAILARFGTLDRMALRKALSDDPNAKQDLEAILHPLIAEKSAEAFIEQQTNTPHAPIILYEASLLIEAGRLSDVQGLIIVTSPLPDRVKRIMERDRVTEDQANAMINAQNTDEFRLKHPHYRIKNDGNLLHLEQEVTKVLDQIISS